MKRFILFFLAFVAFCHCFSQTDSLPDRQAGLPSFVKDSLDNYVNRALTDWQIPGIAVCVIKNGKVIVMKGYGVKDY
ncbi:MAG: hypothetical protein ACHQF0_13940, partial [Chitinophagales bacterium]